MDRAKLNEIRKQPYLDPEVVLKRLRAIEPAVAAHNLDPKVKALRTNELKEIRELRQAALFCHGMSCRNKQHVRFCLVGASDYDFVARWESDTFQHFAPVQLKELVPGKINPKASLQSLINTLTKYQASRNLTVGIHLNRSGRFDPRTLYLPHLSIAALWIFWSASPNQSQWSLYGNMIEAPECTHFEYPT